MKIDDSLKKTAGLGVNTTQTRSGKSADKAGAVSQAPAESGTVHLSTKMESLTQLGGASVFDAKKVEEIKAAIAEGRFQVDAEKVANGLLDTVSDLIRSRKA
ncbi:flagellar biosynthesis anti-sigma factor FlgM [Noviherbaspirillum sp.]|uniref:flagellar biosynthesis anti-sigma factor FlgM n=1 Tax=Noviherbaspirillum sp. TaxID=1926288 RepID=UPI002D301EF5|nr:flagellar biosynthesis anti-sigma factor FlgM [Noviherbaspirillum sp.]HZW20284.1 flagellar biosynthesis anti-sigma factor FlgM [Noviherbaspirillum sp.]